MAKNTGKVREFCQSGKVGTLYILLNVLVCELFSAQCPLFGRLKQLCLLYRNHLEFCGIML